MDESPKSEPVGVILHPDQIRQLVPGRAVPDEVTYFEPMGRRVLVMCEDPIKKTKAGIFIPDEAQSRPAVGWVIAVGPTVGAYDPALPNSYIGPTEGLLGRKVLFGQYAGQAIQLGVGTANPYESDYVLLTDSDLWGFMHGADSARAGLKLSSNTFTVSGEN
jgi:chaperonin GroES